MGLSTAERNKRKRERKKRERQEQRKKEEAEAQKELQETVEKKEDDVVEIDYVAEQVAIVPAPLPAGVPQESAQEDSIENVFRRFQERAAVVTDDDDDKTAAKKVLKAALMADNIGDEDDDEELKEKVSKRKLRELTRPSVAELKRSVRRPDLVEAHDVTAANPDFLIHLKSVPGTVRVPRHWGRKRKYLQGKRGFEKPPFQLPEFISKTGIMEVRDAVAEDESNMSAKQKNRGRVAPKMGAIDVDYRTLHDAFFKFQSKPKNLTKFGDLYYEGKEMETQTNIKPGGPYSKNLREALGFVSESSPPPWLINMQRYGPPPSYPSLKIPGLNFPLPNDQCQYGYHPDGWGKPPVDAYSRPLYGGNPFDPPGSGGQSDANDTGLVTSDGKTMSKADWGSLPHGDFGSDGMDKSDEEEEESTDEEMEESSEDEVEEPVVADGQDSVLPPPPTDFSSSNAPLDLRKQAAGDETPMTESAPQQLYQVLPQTLAKDQSGQVFASEVAYVMPNASGAGVTPTAASVPEGAESALSKALPPSESAKRKNKLDKDDDIDDLGKSFKF